MPSVTPTPSPKDKTIADLTAALTQAAAKLKEQDEILKQMAQLPGLTARVTHLLKDDLILLDGHIIMETPKKLKGKLKIGTWLHVSKSPMGGVGIIDAVVQEDIHRHLQIHPVGVLNRPPKEPARSPATQDKIKRLGRVEDFAVSETAGGDGIIKAELRAIEEVAAKEVSNRDTRRNPVN